MKFQIITEDEANAIRSAKKVLENLVKRYARLREKSGYVSSEKEEPHYRMYKELASLKVDVGIEHNGNKEIIQLSLPSKMWGIDLEDF